MRWSVTGTGVGGSRHYARALLAGSTALALAACGSASSVDVAPIPVPSVSSAPAPSLDAFYGQEVTWNNCGDAECTTVTVPLDYENPDGRSVKLAVTRVRATGKAIGSLFVNPGGPGGSAFDYAKAASRIVSPSVHEVYDVVGVDPRGVQKSDPIACLTDAQVDELIAVDTTPNSADEEALIVSTSKEPALTCEKNADPVMRFMGTANAARDLDIVRSVVGDASFNYLGKSYGTYLGAVYAELFPTRVGRMVLDGVLPPDLDLTELSLGQAKAFEVAFNDFARDCSEQDDCPFEGSASDVAQQIRDTLTDLDANPIEVEGRSLNEGVATYAVLSYLYFPPSDYPRLREALARVVNEQDGTRLLELLDERMSRGPDGRYLDNSTDAFYAVTCADRPSQVTVDETRALASEWRTLAPTFGESLAWGLLVCNDWPQAPEPPITSITATGSAPILVVSTTHDPATPYEWGQRLAGQLDNVVLLTWDGYNHTAYLEGSDCVTDAVDAYLLAGAMPKAGLICD
jgi:pimeloyl-ACP methyl ester carboxylesterase